LYEESKSSACPPFLPSQNPLVMDQCGYGVMTTIETISVPDTKLCKEITELVRDTESDLLFNHSSRVYFFGALTGQRRGLRFDPELLYAGAMFHDMGLTHQHSSQTERFEVDGANAARGFLKARNVAPNDIDVVWTAIALHTTPGVPVYMHPVIALVTAGVEMDVLGIAYQEFTDVSSDKDPHFARGSFCTVIRGSDWQG
jgi:HD domain